MTKKKKIEMNLEDARLLFPRISSAMREFNAIPMDPKNYVTMKKREHAFIRLNVLVEEADLNLDAEGEALELLKKSTQDFRDKVMERAAKNPRVTRGNPRYPAVMQEEGRLQILARMVSTDYDVLSERMDKYSEKLKAFIVITREFQRLFKNHVSEIRLHAHYIESQVKKMRENNELYANSFGELREFLRDLRREIELIEFKKQLELKD